MRLVRVERAPAVAAASTAVVIELVGLGARIMVPEGASAETVRVAMAAVTGAGGR